MNYLLDANAFLDLIKRRKTLIKGQYILDLTMYEVSNAIWKEVVLFKTLTKDEAVTLMNEITNIVQKLNIIRIQDDLDKIMEIAIKERLTFYDAAYLYFAKKYQLILITNDKKLYNAAKDKIKVLRSDEIS